jgi:hypothetical protein
MAIRWDRDQHVYYDDVTNENVPHPKLDTWINPDGTSNDIP